MARGKKKTKLADLPAQSDPSTELDSATFLRAAQPVLKQLESDLIARAKASLMVTAALKARHASDKASKRTADTFAQWQRNFIDQVAAAWLLSCVFVRTLEDRGLLGHPRIAGPGASDSQKLFFQMAPSLTERDYLLTVFRELTHFEAARDLFDAKHNPVWLLAPSAESAKALLALFRTPSSDTPAFRFGQPDTRFLGDLYQDLNERVRKRYALLQTPRFVESFILDRTLERAIERFGLDDTTVIDPTCGSGHFLLGSFDRLYEHWLRAEPGLDPRQAAHKALDAVFGADINPYAVGIARFRLTLSFLEKAGFKKLADAPQLPLHLVVADSLLHNPHLEQASFADMEDQSIKEWKGQEFALEDEGAARDVLHRTYAAVVGNPPYITVKDKALRDRYRELYPNSAGGKYSLAAPFAERFFQLGRDAAYVGMITANSFMKREFGKKLIEKYLPTVNLDIIINTSGAYIPGHGTPTVLLFGTAEEPQGNDVLAVLASRAEESTPTDPERGHVWRSIADHWSDVGFENDYISVSRVERASLAEHPWTLSGGGASELKALLEERSDKTLNEVAEHIGFASFTGLDDAFILPQAASRTLRIETALARPMVTGECVRDWAIVPHEAAVTPYQMETQEPLALDSESNWGRFLWRFRTVASNVASFGGKTREEEGQRWWEWYRWQSERYRARFRITFASVATHNHFVLDRGGKVFKQSAPIIKLPEDATEDDHLALLAYLNSSTACFWMKQVCHNKSNASQKHSTDPARAAYDFAGKALESLPVFEVQSEACEAAAALLDLGTRRARWVGGYDFADNALEALRSAEDYERYLASNWRRYDELTRRMVYIQEELDWAIYGAAGLLEPESARVELEPAQEAHRGGRPFERIAGYADGVSSRARREEHKSTNPCVLPEHWPSRSANMNDSLLTLERREYKRMWRDTERNVDQRLFRDEVSLGWVRSFISTALESAFEAVRMTGAQTLAKELDTNLARTAAELLGADTISLVRKCLQDDAVPYLDAYIYSDGGLAKRATWLMTWDLQRREDRGENVAEVVVPPNYSQGSRGKSTDFQESRYWRLRGKLDVPKERFISYPGCESDEDGEPLYGWAGWNHLERMQALAALYQERKKQGWRAHTGPDADGEQDERLIPMLAGLLELLPWVKQWHNEPSEEFDGLRLGDYFERFINGECRELGLTHDDLKDWRPSEKKSRRRKKRGS